MRLIRLKIRNIASLQGEHEINFQEIQKISSLFAITGETGSGKSTVLNCLGLALYGQLYKRNLGQLDVVTLGEKEGSIELIFQVRDKFYLADWRARVRKQNGELYSTPQSPVRHLYKIEGTDFSAPKNIAEKSAQELLNLDFDQFCKCIILNQGEFARFLQSSFTERKEILEKLYPGELLESMGRELSLEIENLKKEKAENEIKLGELEGDHTSGENLKEQKKSFETNLRELDDSFKHFERIDYHFVSLSSYHQKFLDKEQNKEIIKKEMAYETTKFNQFLKLGEESLAKFEAIRRLSDERTPILQKFLTQEENLRNLEESFESVKKRKEVLTKNIFQVEEKLKTKRIEERSSEDHLRSIRKELTHSLDELKAGKSTFDDLFDTFSDCEGLRGEVKGKLERLNELENAGKELKAQVEQIENHLKTLPQDIEAEKMKIQLKLEKKQRAVFLNEELKRQIATQENELGALTTLIQGLKTLMTKTMEDILPLEATLKLQEVLNATEVCVDHAIKSHSNECPVCTQTVSDNYWTQLKTKLATTNLTELKKRFDQGNLLIEKSKREEEIHQQKLLTLSHDIILKKQELDGVNQDLNGIDTLAQDLEVIKKQVWEKETLLKDFETKKIDLQKSREAYQKIRSDYQATEKLLENKEKILTSHHEKISAICPVIDRDSIRDLKLEVKNFNLYLVAETALQKILQDKNHLLEVQSNLTKDNTTLNQESETYFTKINQLKTDLEENLKGEKASELIRRMSQDLKSAEEDWNKKREEQTKQEALLKNLQGRMSQLEELTKEFDLHFSKELQALKELGHFETGREETQSLLQKMQTLTLDFSSPKELFIPLKSLIDSEKEHFKEEANLCRMNLASVSTRLGAWEKVQDKIQLFKLKAHDIQQNFERKMRLFEVLGKDELRTFVLSLVEENLIYQTNEELQKLCQGRYEIVHQTRSLRMVPEFFILDKFREGGKRKVSTLSGGETFMVSLAMALGLAEMTRGQAEIDSLFIDEGFGTLDQDSLEDVLDMLQQIQTRGLMVGIISHIKSLTLALPVNLVLQKKQDGISSVGIRLN